MVEVKTPCVFVRETAGFAASVVEVPTSIPAFIGYTAKAEDNGRDLLDTPFRIASLAEYLSAFGGPPADAYDLARDAQGAWTATPAQPRHYLYESLRMFFGNGGGAAYIVSVGPDTQVPAASDLLRGLDALKTVSEPAILVAPDAMSLASHDDVGTVQRALLVHCRELQSRVAILDLYDGDRGERTPPSFRAVRDFRDRIGGDGLDYGAAYFPWIEAMLVSPEELGVARLSPAALDELRAALAVSAPDYAALTLPHAALLAASPDYRAAMRAVADAINRMPPSGGVAGVYAHTDFTRGVFKAPAGTSLTAAVRPLVAISDSEQEDLNVPLDGKAVNPIRAIPGYGVMIWGARTLNGNSEDLRYINVRRTLIMLEQSIKGALQAYAFEPNAPATWTSAQAMIENFLLNQWKAGALLGATSAQAFHVAVGLGATMTAQDVRDGLMKIVVSVSVAHPAEFLQLQFQQAMSTDEP